MTLHLDRETPASAARQLLGGLPAVGEVVDRVGSKTLTADLKIGEDGQAEAGLERRSCLTIASFSCQKVALRWLRDIKAHG